jgi:ATP-dependent Clp protease ATP-binding subunit ClpC
MVSFSYNSRYRYKDVRAHKTLTSITVLTVFLSTLGLTALAVFLTFFVAYTNYVLSLAVISASFTIGSLLLLTFGKTYYSSLPPRLTVSELKSTNQKRRAVNIALAASFSFIQALGPHGRSRSKKDLLKSIQTLIYSSSINHFLKRFQMDRAKVLKAIESQVLPQLTWKKYCQEIVNTAVSMGHGYLEPEHALGALLLHPDMQAHLRSTELTEDDVRFGLWWGAEYRLVQDFRRRWWSEERLLSFTGIGLSWASGFTPFVDKFTRIPRGSFWEDIIYGHESKVEELINTLARQRQSNVLLVGDPGVGRLGIIRSLARKIRASAAHVDLNGQRLLYINIAELIAQGTSGAGQMAVVSHALREMERSGNIIAVIDGLSSALGESGEQRVNLTEILLPFLASMSVRVVVMTSQEDYHLRLKSNQELTQYFEVVLVPGLSEENTLKRLALTISAIERKAKLTIPYKTIRELVESTSSIMPHVPFPERAFDFLEEAIVLAQTRKDRVLMPEHIYTLISRKIGINFGNMKKNERDKLLDLEKIRHKRLVNQNTAVNTVAKAMIRARAEVRSQKRPIGTFLFLGPTGVGKTETAKTLAETYFGSEDHMVRLDMSEFQGNDGVARLIGSIKQPIGRLTSLIADNPFTVLLLDEFEKADEQVHQVFLQVLDEGFLTDVSGRKYSFLHTIIIATSNAGAELIRQAAKNGKVPKGFSEKLKEHILSNNILRPELLNRFDSVVTYSSLSPDHIRQIGKLMLRKLNKRLDEEHGVKVAVTEDLIEFLIEIGYDPEFGARPMTRAIQDTVEYAVAQMVLKGQLTPGQKITLPIPALRQLRKA